ncbi:MAG: response regulator [Gemmatimonadota bacterium]|nr:response regulator [Gemmatimonadota bacterium]
MEPTILVVDDTPSALITARMMLAYDGYRVVTAADGAEALAKTRQERPDVILLDVMMPGMDGIDVCKRLRAEKPNGVAAAIVMLTALGDSSTCAAALHAGADDFLAKPVNKWELRARIGSLVRLGLQRQQALADKRFRVLVDGSSDGFVFLAANRSVIDANAAARRLLGIATEDFNMATFEAIADRRFLGELNPPIAVANLVTQDHPRAYYAARKQNGVGPAWIAVREVCADPGGESTVHIVDASAQIATTARPLEFHDLVSRSLRQSLVALSGVLHALGPNADQQVPVEASLIGAVRTSGAQLRDRIVDVLDCLDVRTRRTHETPIATACAAMQQVADEDHVALQLAASPDDSVGAIPISESSFRGVFRELLLAYRSIHVDARPTMRVTLTRPAPSEVAFLVEDDSTRLDDACVQHQDDPYSLSDVWVSGDIPDLGPGFGTVRMAITAAGGSAEIDRRSGPSAGVRVTIRLPLVAT